MRLKAKTYGPWTFNPQNFTLEHENGYYVNLDEIVNCPELADWIFQVASKGWADEKTVYWMITALNQLIRPQATLCSCGAERGPINPRQIIPFNVMENEKFEKMAAQMRDGPIDVAE